ncbi:hypothetical protein CAPTEDRAFT_218660 [Capitella teleta]|uniref:Uncharacterized protein n=1 Tax=Capitella teleta TaxID=283909 RepID=R7VHP6_CAPTE|nr:hypothetical protein CAPTEDRAFT_218660 [Capitella teleta]|eukprot:ELU18139.1 hypothetical protein CAPTEDRAFT_218660 [Capitella teleta]
MAAILLILELWKPGYEMTVRLHAYHYLISMYFRTHFADAKRVNFHATEMLVAIMIEVKERIIHLQGEVDCLKISSTLQGEATEAVSFLFEILQFDKEGEFKDFCSELTEERKRKQVQLYKNSAAKLS